jgi:Family of unknown function (DUF6491)
MMARRTQRCWGTILVALVSVGGCSTPRTQPTPASDGFPGTADCVMQLYIQNFDVIDPATLIVYAPTPKDAFLLKLAQPVPDLNSRESIGFEAAHHDGQICGVNGDLLVRTPAPNRVAVTAVRALRGAEVKQLKAAAKANVATPAAAAAAAAPGVAQP